MRTEGVYTYFCSKCETFFAVVSRFAVASDFSEVLKCPKCGSNAGILGEGFIKHEKYESKKIEQLKTIVEIKNDSYPEILRVNHISAILGVSKRVAYEIMEYKGFPLIRVGRLKRVNRELFFQWLDKQKNN